DHSLREIDLICLPLSIPTELIADVSEMQLGDSLHVRDIALPEGVELKSDPNLSVVSVVAPKVEEEETPEEEGVEAEEGVEGEEAPAEGEESKTGGPAEAADDAKDGE
ncbi:MAG: 50S ribosomal protein L25, partial [Myxococcota bacterium]|nr:50S ribosomal protein L25 [Myxococcota bacterium]